MTIMPPFPISPTISLNRVRIMDLPGISIPETVKGKTGYQLVSAATLTELIRQHSDALQLDASMSDHTLRLAFNTCFTSHAGSIQQAARAVAAALGRNLGYVLLTLKRGDALNRAAREEWDDSYWTYWGQINQVWLGGGLVSGSMGAFLCKAALAVLHDAGFPDYAIHISPYAGFLPLIGAARHAPLEMHSALVLDFGGTAIKRGYAAYQDGTLTAFYHLPSLPARWNALEQAPDEQLTRMLDEIVSIIAGTWRTLHAVQPTLSTRIPVSMASYIKDGHPIPTQGGTYVQLDRITENLQAELNRRLSRALGQEMSTHLLHDGTTAATVYAGERDTAVITVGTALGIGFPPLDDTGLRPLSENFQFV